MFLLRLKFNHDCQHYNKSHILDHGQSVAAVYKSQPPMPVSWIIPLKNKLCHKKFCSSLRPIRTLEKVCVIMTTYHGDAGYSVETTHKSSASVDAHVFWTTWRNVLFIVMQYMLARKKKQYIKISFQAKVYLSEADTL